MTHDWMIDVLTDLRKYARTNQFPALAEMLDDTILVAAMEFRDRMSASNMAEDHDGETGTHHRDLEGHSLPR